jgi:hypothetical protein
MYYVLDSWKSLFSLMRLAHGLIHSHYGVLMLIPQLEKAVFRYLTHEMFARTSWKPHPTTHS